MSQFYFSHIVLIQSTFTVLLLALSIQIQFRMGVFSFAGAGFYAIGSYGAAMLVLHAGFDSVSAILVTTACAASSATCSPWWWHGCPASISRWRQCRSR